MSVDPRYISEWLRTQWTTDITNLVFNKGTSQTTEPDSRIDFAQLLSLFLSRSPDREDGASGPASTAGALVPLAAKFPAYRVAASLEDDSAERGDVERIVAEASERFGVEQALVMAVIRAESNCRSDAVSSAGAKGLMQLMDGTARTLGVTDPFDPEQNVHGGTRFLSFLLHKYNGNAGVALAAYNAGPGRVDRLGIRTDADLAAKLDALPAETQRYVGKVLGYREQYRST